MKLVISDENQKTIGEFDYFDSFWNQKFEKISNLTDIDDHIKKLLNTLECAAVVYTPIDKKDDFYVSYSNSILKNVIHSEVIDIEGMLLSDILSVFDKDEIILNRIIDIYNNNRSQKFFLEYYNGTILNKRLRLIINRIDNFLYLLSEDETDYYNLSIQQQKLFETDFSAIVIIQDGHIAKVNKKYMEVYNQDDYDQVIGQKLGYTGLDVDTINRLDENIQKVLDGKMFSYSIPLEIEKDGKLLYYFNLNGNYTIYKGKPAVMLIHYDITEQEINRRKLEKRNKEALILQKNFEFIQSVSKTGITYLIDNKYIRSREFYNIIERDPLEEDVHKDIILDIVIDDDKYIVEENYEKILSRKDFTDFIARIKTAKGNIKYIHCYLRYNDSENSYVMLYQDVTDEQLYLNGLKEALTESLRLEQNLKKIQNISKTGMGYYNSQGELEWTKSSFELLKLDEEKYKNYHGDLSEIILDEDLSYWKEAHEKCSPENPEATFVIRVINGEGNIVYLNCFVRYEYSNNNKSSKRIIFYQDITEQIERENKLKEALDNSLRLEKNFEKIQRISKISMCYSEENGDYIWFNKGYDVMELGSDQYNGDMSEYLLEEDKKLWANAHRNCTPENPETSFVQRALVDNRLIYIKTYVAYEFDKNGNKKSHISLLQNITESVKKENKLKDVLRETLNLQNSLNRIQSLSKTSMGYSDGSKYSKWTSEVFDLLEIEPEDYENDMDNIIERFVIDEDLPVRKEAISKITPEHPDVTFNQRIKTGKGNIKYLKTIIYQKYNNQGNILDRISFNQDITEEVERENKLKEVLDETLNLQDSLNRIQSLSKTAIGYSDESRYSKWTPEVFDLLEIEPEDYENDMDNIIERFVIDEDLPVRKEAISKITSEHSDVTFNQRIKTGKGNIKYLKTIIHQEYDDTGNILDRISFNQDITEEVERENKLKEVLDETLNLQDSLNRIQSLSKTAIGYSDGSRYSKWTPEVFDLLEIEPEDYENDMDNIIERFVIDEDLPVRKEAISKITPEHSDVTFNQRIKTGKGNIKYLKTIICQEYDDTGNVLDRISFNQDITREVEYQNQLKTAINDKEVLLTEVHHRVKNNLQIILSLINLNKNYNTEPETILNDTETRIYAMALIHEKIYGSKSLSNVNIKDYVESLVESLLDTYMSNIQFHSDMDSLDLKMDEAIPLGLIINELVVNSIKYAFPSNEEGNLYIQFKETNNQYCLIVKDDGKGLPDDFDLDNLTNLGLTVVQSLVLQIDGMLSVIDCEGTGFKIQFNKT